MWGSAGVSWERCSLCQTLRSSCVQSIMPRILLTFAEQCLWTNVLQQTSVYIRKEYSSFLSPHPILSNLIVRECYRVIKSGLKKRHVSVFIVD